jgi:glycosyltransferase involved in cell wall biosynthesis
MKIVVAHNTYQLPGGEDEVFRSETALLRAAGHEVFEYVRDNREIRQNGLISRAQLAASTVWSRGSYGELRDLLARVEPDVAHFHNTFPLMSPAVYDACIDAGVPVVQSLHNPRLMCPAATLYRNGSVCEDCVGAVPWRGVVHGCYRGSRAQTAVVSAMVTYHRLAGTWAHKVDCYIVFTEFYRRKFIDAGLPAEKIVVKPHFIHPDPGPRRGGGEFALYLGRLAEEKGIGTVLDAWQALSHVPLKIRGDGPLLDEVQHLAAGAAVDVELVPRLPKPALVDLIKRTRFLVWPSQGYYENFGLVAAEAFACGVPVIASGIGAMAEMVVDGRTGLHFAPGDARDLAAKVNWASAHPHEMAKMGLAARAEYERRYTAPRNAELLQGIYDGVIQAASRARRSRGRISDSHLFAAASSAVLRRTTNEPAAQVIETAEAISRDY